MVGEDESNIVKYALKNEEKKLIEKAITKVLEGNIVKKRGMYYQTNGKEFSVDVLATGLKSYAILKILLDMCRRMNLQKLTGISYQNRWPIIYEIPVSLFRIFGRRS